MKFSLFLKDKGAFLGLQCLMIAFIGFMLNVFRIGREAIFFICGVMAIGTLGIIFYDYLIRNKYYKELYQVLDQLEKKHLISEMLERSSFLEGQILYDILRSTSKSMNDELATYKLASESYREYIETWIHEVKLPISCIHLICENNINETTRSILEENSRIEGFVEQALFYARSTTLEKDYIIRNLNLEKVIKTTLKKHSKQLIACKCKLNFQNLNHTVFTDAKWIEFIIGQIISNSIKYKKEHLELSFSAEETQTNIILSIIDNGIGIPKKDLKYIFDKSFTGENGRKYGKSTGIGLYLCSVLCSKMHLGIRAFSKEKEGTTIQIIFPKDKALMFE